MSVFDSIFLFNKDDDQRIEIIKNPSPEIFELGRVLTNLLSKSDFLAAFTFLESQGRAGT